MPDEYFTGEEENTRLLQHILAGVTTLVVVLVIVLVYVTKKTRRFSQNRFKLLDNSGNSNQPNWLPPSPVWVRVTRLPRVPSSQSNQSYIADNVSSYQSVSPASTLLPPVSTPSPLPSRRPSPAVSPSPSSHRLVSPAPSGTVYDRQTCERCLMIYGLKSTILQYSCLL